MRSSPPLSSISGCGCRLERGQGIGAEGCRNWRKRRSSFARPHLHDLKIECPSPKTQQCCHDDTVKGLRQLPFALHVVPADRMIDDP